MDIEYKWVGTFYCKDCLRWFPTKYLLDNHKKEVGNIRLICPIVVDNDNEDKDAS